MSFSTLVCALEEGFMTRQLSQGTIRGRPTPVSHLTTMEVWVTTGVTVVVLQSLCETDQNMPFVTYNAHVLWRLHEYLIFLKLKNASIHLSITFLTISYVKYLSEVTIIMLIAVKFSLNHNCFFQIQKVLLYSLDVNCKFNFKKASILGLKAM